MEEKKILVEVSKPQIANMLDAALRTKPKGYGRKSYATYFKRTYAEWLQKSLDKMAIDRQPHLFDIKKFPSISLQSLYLRVNQAFQYLTDPEKGMDNDGKYAALREVITVSRIPNCGVKLSFDVILEGAEAEPVVEGESVAPKWRRLLDAYLESPNPASKPFYQGSLALTPVQVEDLTNELFGLDGVIAEISATEVKVIKSI